MILINIYNYQYQHQLTHFSFVRPVIILGLIFLGLLQPMLLVLFSRSHPMLFSCPTTSTQMLSKHYHRPSYQLKNQNIDSKQ